MAKLIKRKDLNIEDYDKAVLKSNVNTLYAESWYMDTLLGHSWAAIVSDDYNLVMPIPYSRNYRFFFRKRIMQPMFCQQLGLYGESDLVSTPSKKLIDLIISLKPYTYQFNRLSRMLLEETNFIFKERHNYILPLSTDYDQIKKVYSSNLSRNLKKAKNQDLEFSIATDENTWSAFLEIKRKQLRLFRQKRWTQRIGRIMKSAINQGKGYFAVVKSKENILAMAFMVKSKNRLVYLFAVKTEQGGKIGANHYLIDQIIRLESGKNIILDFEGSDVQGVARFFKSFGAVNEPYFSLKQ